MINKKYLNSIKNRKIIYDYIKDHPGIHLNKLFRQLKLSDSTVRYHLKYLISHDFVADKKEKGYIRYYVTYKISNYNKNILSHLRVDTKRNILLYILIFACASEKELAKSLDKTDSTINYHLEKLIDECIVEIAFVKKNLVQVDFHIVKYIKRDTDNREKIYKLKDPYLIFDTFISYKDTFFDNDFTKVLLDYFKMLFENKNVTHNIVNNSLDKCISNTIDFFQSTFRSPFSF